MLYVILEKDLATEAVNVHSVWNDEQSAVEEMGRLIDATEDYGYRIHAVEKSE